MFWFSQKIEQAKEEIKEELRKELRVIVLDECCRLVFELFSEEEETKKAHTGWGVSYDIKTLRGIILDSARDAASDFFTKRYISEAHRVISSEKFIDSIVARIKKKQL